MIFNIGFCPTRIQNLSRNVRNLAKSGKDSLTLVTLFERLLNMAGHNSTHLIFGRFIKLLTSVNSIHHLKMA